jgi:hypothetical protein
MLKMFPNTQSLKVWQSISYRSKHKRDSSTYWTWSCSEHTRYQACNPSKFVPSGTKELNRDSWTLAPSWHANTNPRLKKIITNKLSPIKFSEYQRSLQYVSCVSVYITWTSSVANPIPTFKVWWSAKAISASNIERL